MPKKVLVVMGSQSDLPVLLPCLDTLDRLGIAFEVRICSAHRSPQQAIDLADQARDQGFSVILAAAGLAAHLPGVLASRTNLPVIGIPIASGPLSGQDALYAIVQMPPGIPVATVAINGAVNAAVLAAQMLAISDDAILDKLKAHRRELQDALAGQQDELDRALLERSRQG